MSNIASAIKATEAALEKGDYGICIKIIDPLLLDFQAETVIGGQLRLLIITAYIGKGDEQKAINICQTLIHNKKESIRHQEFAAPRAFYRMIRRLQAADVFLLDKTGQSILMKAAEHGIPQRALSLATLTAARFDRLFLVP